MPERPLSISGGSGPSPDRPVATHPADVPARVLLAMLHGARDRGDRAEAERAWKLIVTAELERVRGIASAFRHQALPGGWIPQADVDDVTHDVFLRLHDKVDSLQGRSVGELRAFMRKATEYTCRDYVARHVKGDQRRAGSLDAGATDLGRAATDHALGQLAEQLARDDEEAQFARAVVHPALALVDPDKRSVLIMVEAGFETEEIVERLGISRDTVYQRKRRGLLQLADAIRELAGEDADR